MVRERRLPGEQQAGRRQLGIAFVNMVVTFHRCGARDCAWNRYRLGATISFGQ